ncbi:MAG: DUF1302 family protein [Steroidobacteraceae bacterium]
MAVAHCPGLDRSGHIRTCPTDYSIPDGLRPEWCSPPASPTRTSATPAGTDLPQLDVAWDFHGTSPNAVPFVEGRRAATLSLSFVHRDKWKFGVGYTRFWGGGSDNLMQDRDFLSMITSVSF